MENSEGIIKDLVQDEYFHKLIIDPDNDCIEFWTRWEIESPERKNFISEAKKIILSAEFKSHTLTKDRKDLLWENISARIDEKSIEFSVKRGNFIRYIGYAVAASIALVLVVIFSMRSNFHQSKENVAAEVKHIEKEAPKGKISSFKFEDGTVVKLFSGTKIRYPEKFSTHNREVYVEGEAYFDVSKDKNRPFVVNTNSLITTAIGTSFNVRTYDKSNNCDVSLVSGKVKVEKLNKSVETLNEIILEPGEEAYLVNSGVTKQAFNLEEKLAWKDGYIYLNDKSFNESIEILKRWYHVDFVVKNQYKASEKKGTGKFKNQSLENILDVMGHSFDFSFEFAGDKVYVNFK